MKCELFIVIDADENYWADEDRDAAIEAWSKHDGVVPARVIKLTLQIAKPVAEEFLGTIQGPNGTVHLTVSDSPGAK